MKRAFTLVELLVVIAVIAILIGVLLPALSGARLQARKAATLSRLRDLGVSMSSYMIDFQNNGPTIGDEDSKAFLGLEVLALYQDTPAESFININTHDLPATIDEKTQRLVLARLDDDPIETDTGVAPGDVPRIAWSCSYSYDPDVKPARERDRLRVYLGDRADYEEGRTLSANWGGRGACCLWTDQHAGFVRSKTLADQDDPNMYHHNEFGGEGSDEVENNVHVTRGTVDTHLRFFSEEEDDTLLPD